ncbi:MAG: hypothetical protein R2843_15715 [Thermomicrobiales bacterium]
MTRHSGTSVWMRSGSMPGTASILGLSAAGTGARCAWSTRFSPLLPRETPDDVRSILADLRDAIDRIFGERLLALYLTGSLTYGDFDPGSSDIDYLPCWRNRSPMPSARSS